MRECFPLEIGANGKSGISTRAYVHVQTLQRQSIATHLGQGNHQITMPDAVLAVLTAGVETAKEPIIWGV